MKTNYRYFLFKSSLPIDKVEAMLYGKSRILFDLPKPSKVLGIIDFTKFDFELRDLTIFHENLFDLRKNNVINTISFILRLTS